MELAICNLIGGSASYVDFCCTRRLVNTPWNMIMRPGDKREKKDRFGKKVAVV